MNSTRKAVSRPMECARPRTRDLDVAAAVALVLVSAGRLASANPIGPQIVAGQVSVAGAGKQLTVTNSPGSIINWQSFSIGTCESSRLNMLKRAQFGLR